MKRSRDFYEKVLNQKVTFDFGENIAFEGFAIHLKSHYQGLIDDKEVKLGGNNFELYFEDNDLENVVKRLEEYGVTFVHPLREQPWRQMVVRFYDPDENIIEVGESMEHAAYRLYKAGMEIEKISAATLMPEEFVRKAIEMYQ
jgi:catechol 2,3-dioxygenase-like lactoylglutathione lyase family enzyme